MPDSSGRAANDPLKDVKQDNYDEWFQASPDPWAAIAALEFGADRTVANAAEVAVWTSDDAQRADLEKKLLSALKGARGQTAAMLSICRLLSMVGGEASVPALAALVKDPATADDARIALAPIPGPAADAALREALTTLTGDELAGLIGSVAARRDAAARPALEKLAADSTQPPIVRATAKNALAAFVD